MVHRVSILNTHGPRGTNKRLGTVKAIWVSGEAAMRQFTVDQAMFHLFDNHRLVWVSSWMDSELSRKSTSSYG